MSESHSLPDNSSMDTNSFFKQKYYFFLYLFFKKVKLDDVV